MNRYVGVLFIIITHTQKEKYKKKRIDKMKEIRKKHEGENN